MRSRRAAIKEDFENLEVTSMAGLGPTELIIVLVIVLLLFGAKKIPELAGSLGKSVKEFRRSSAELNEHGTSLPD